MQENPSSNTPKESSLHDDIDRVRELLEENLRYTKTIHEFTPKNSKQKEDEYLKLLQDSLEYSKANYVLFTRLKRFFLWHKIYIILQLLLILVPIILGIIYLPPLLENTLTPYLELLETVKER